MYLNIKWLTIFLLLTLVTYGKSSKNEIENNKTTSTINSDVSDLFLGKNKSPYATSHLSNEYNNTEQYFYCVALDNGGLDFVTKNPIKSKAEYKQYKLAVTKRQIDANISSKLTDALYYSVTDEYTGVIARGYGIMTGKLREVLQLDKEGRLKSKTTYMVKTDEIPFCFYKYKTRGNQLFVIEACDNRESQIREFEYNDKKQQYSLASIKYFKYKAYHERFKIPSLDENNFYKKDVYTKSGEIFTYNTNGSVVKKNRNIKKSDTCMPFVPYYE